jgi:hypothetical protein
VSANMLRLSDGGLTRLATRENVALNMDGRSLRALIGQPGPKPHCFPKIDNVRQVSLNGAALPLKAITSSMMQPTRCSFALTLDSAMTPSVTARLHAVSRQDPPIGFREPWKCADEVQHTTRTLIWKHRESI